VELDETGREEKPKSLPWNRRLARQRNMTVRAILENGKANPGSFVKVYVSSGLNKKAILIPTNAPYTR
jgi:hypothetical protein